MWSYHNPSAPVRARDPCSLFPVPWFRLELVQVLMLVLVLGNRSLFPPPLIHLASIHPASCRGDWSYDTSGHL